MILLSFLLSLPLALVLAAEPAVPPMASPWAQTATAGTYAKASAHDPALTDRGVWPLVSGKEAFAIQVWPKSRLLVWAHPGKKGGDRDGLDVLALENWLENGKPATRPWDEETDVLIPASSTPYRVDLRRAVDAKNGWFEGAPHQSFRHITIEAGATFATGGDGIGRRITGNVWIKKGGATANQGPTTFIGERHTFFRNDNDGSGDDPRNHRASMQVSQYFHFAKAKDASVEIVGRVTLVDEFKIEGTTVIIGVDSEMRPGRDANPYVRKGGTLALMDGARFWNIINSIDSPDLEVDGILCGGLPGRPLKRGALLLLNHKNHSNAQVPASLNLDKRLPTRVPSLVLRSGAQMRTHKASADARLTIRWAGETGISSGWRMPPGSWIEKESLEKDPNVKSQYAWLDALPKGIDVWVGTGAAIDDVEIDHLRLGGLMVADTSTASSLKAVFGPACLGKGKALVSEVTALNSGCGY